MNQKPATPPSTSIGPPSEPSILEKILHEAEDFRRRGRPFLTVFDLDSTLFDLTLRISAIIDAFANTAENKERFPIACEALKTVEIQRTDWGIGEALNRLNLTREQHPLFWEDMHRFWASGFFSNDYLHHDEPLPGAVDFVNELRAVGAHVMYLTGRDVGRMLPGTEKSLKDCGFPLHETEARLVLKPRIQLDDARFKVEVLSQESSRYEKIWLFENEPVNLNLTAAECPQIGLVFIDTTHSGREQVAETLERIRHFEVNLEDFRRHYGRSK